jgi:hypothetical protein
MCLFRKFDLDTCVVTIQYDCHRAAMMKVFRSQSCADWYNITCFLTIKPARRTNFSNLFFEWNSICFGTVPLSIIRSFSLYTQQWYTSISNTFADSLRAWSRWHILILLASCQQTCMTYAIAVCTVNNSWWWTEELSETCRVSFQE